MDKLTRRRFVQLAAAGAGLMPMQGLLAVGQDRATDASRNPTGETNFPNPREFFKVGERISASPEFVIDHTVVYNPAEHKWHMFGIPKDDTAFVHLTANSLTQPQWEKSAPYHDGSRKKIWAPHIVYDKRAFYMYYARIASPREIVYATSADLWTWSQPKLAFALSNEATDDQKNKDPMVLRDKGKWIMYFSMMKDKTKWVVGHSISNDLLSWGKPQICFDDDSADPGVESPFVVRRGDYYYLFLASRPWLSGKTEIFRSKSAHAWKTADKLKSMNWQVPEIIRDLDGKWYITLGGPGSSGFSIWPLYWNDGLDIAETSVPVPRADS
jgi:hypothetical protein